MILRLLILLCLLSGVVCSSTTQLIAQSHSRSLKLKQGDVTLSKDIQYFYQHRDEYSTVAYNGVYYLVLQFESIPDLELKKNLRARNIHLLQYLGSETYLARVPNDIAISDWDHVPILAIEPYSADWKIDPLLRESVPEWAETIPGWGDLTVTVQENHQLQTLKSFIQQIPQAEVLFEYETGGLMKVRIPMEQLDHLLNLPAVAYVEAIDPPAAPENHEARLLSRSNALAGQVLEGLPMNGSGVDVAVGDDGGIGPHIDFHNRQEGIHTTFTGGSHGDHVAGTILGAGNLNPRMQGLAPGASLHEFTYWDAIYSFPNSYTQADIRITSQSLGNGCNTGYNSLAQLVDRQSVAHEGLIHVFSAGNSGGSSCGGLSGGWRTITGGIKSGKNVLAVGAVDNNGTILSFSSKGPSTDGRIKPDVCAVGLSVQSTYPNHSYATSHGTSMACPAVSGVLAQLIQAYRGLNNGSEPEGGLLKAVLLNSATDKGNPGPDFTYGWGIVNAHAAYECLADERFLRGSLQHGETKTHQLTIPAGTQRAKVMVYWTDPEAALNASDALINDLDLVIENAGGTRYDPWVLDAGNSPTPQSCFAAATKGADHRNNVEQVEISAPSGGVYTIKITGTQVPEGPQSYFLVYEWIQNDITLTYPYGGETWVPGESEILQWDAEGNTGSFSLEYSSDNGEIWQSIASIGGASRTYNFSVPTTLTNNGLIRISRSGQSAQNVQTFSVLPVPANLQLSDLCRGAVELRWDAAAGASSYQIFQLGETYMESIGTTTANTFELHGLQPDSTYWFSVNAVGSEGNSGRRAEAVSFTPTTLNACSFPALGVRELLSPVSGVCATLPLTVEAEVENIGPSAISGVEITYQLDNGPLVSEMLPAIASSANLDFSFSQTITELLPGDHQLKVWITQTDGHVRDDTLLTDFSYIPQIDQFPYLEDFELSNGGWRKSGKNSTWEWGTPNAIQITESANGNKAWGTKLSEHHMNNEYSFLESPCFDLSGFLINPVFSFSLVYEMEDESDYAWLEYSEDGLNWVKMGSGGGGGWNWYAATGDRWSGMTKQNIWRMASCPIPVQGMSDPSQVRFRFVLQSSGSTSAEGIVIDDIHIHAAENIYSGPSQQNLSQSVQGNNWHSFYHNGELVAAIHPEGQNLGTVTIHTFRHSGQVRQYNGLYYLNQNWVISPQTQPSTPVRVRLYYPDSEVWDLYSASHCISCVGIDHPYKLGISKYHGSNEDHDVANSTDPGFTFLTNEEVKIIPFSNGYYLETSVMSFSEFWANAGGALGNTGNFPVEWLDFSVEQHRGGALLSWSTASELQNSGFAIEVAYESGLFQQMAFVPGAGTTTEIQSYEFHVPDLATGQYQFRLKQIDIDGRFAYSDIREMTIVARNEMTVYPNPFDTYLTVHLQSREYQTVSLHVFDPVGRELLAKHLPPFSGGQTHTLSLPKKLETGLYFFQVRMGEEVFGKRLWQK